MDLHGMASGAVGTVNPAVPVLWRQSTGYSTNAAKKQVPSYATPGAFVGSIAADVLTVTAATAGKLLRGQTLAGAGIAAGTQIVSVLTGDGGVGTYKVSKSQTVASAPITTSHTITAQIQSLTYGDLRQVEGVNLQGDKKAMYVRENVEAIVRQASKGGDLVTLADGTVWLTSLVLERWPDWAKVTIILQNGS